MDDPDAASPSPAMDEPDPASLQVAMQVSVTVWLGPVGSLLRKLHLLMAPGQGLEPDLLISEDEIRLLQLLCISLKDMSEDYDEASFTSRWWMKVVRELCYDTEDHLDEPCVAGAHQDFSELLARVKDANESRESFHWSPKTINPNLGEARFSRLTYPKLPVPIRAHRIVGLEELPNKLVKLLDLDSDDKTLKVIPITGCAGVGKTTTARTLFHSHGGKFQYRAFVSVSCNPDMRVFLTNMLSQLNAPLPHGFPDVPDLIDAISKHLQGKRYLIIVDDLWTASVWDIISSAFPCGDCCSRIITTTRIDDVAQACCSYVSDSAYKMEPLNDHDSRKLFFARVFGSQYSCPPDFKEVSYEIIRKCGGLPFAIVNIASLLASESNMVMEKWKYIQDSLPSTSAGMKDVLNLMYNSLPRCLRTCLLYLSMYAQGYVMKKDELVKHWVAEGFLSAVGGQDTQEIAEGYFDELVSRGMVQAVDTNNNGNVLSCTVHQMVLDFIRHKSMEENFVITVDYFQSTLSLPDKVRRLSVQFGGVKSAYIPESIVTSHVRSLIFWGFFKCLPSSFMDYGLLRVLVLHIWADRDKKSFDLTTIGKLFLLKYLKIECNITVKLPSKIRRLQYLGTLQVDARLSAVPSDIVNLKRLLHLHVPSESILPRVVGQLRSLRTLAYFDIGSHSEEDVLHLGRLTDLQDLQLTCSTVQSAESVERNVQLLGSTLEKLSALQSLTMAPAASGSYCVNILEDSFSMASPTPDLPLQKIELSRYCCIFFSLPKWFGELRKLCILKIAIRRLSMTDTDMLKGLSALTALTLYIQTVSDEKIVIDDAGFQVLAYFKFMCAAPRLSFVQGAMPRVQKLKIGFNSNRWRPQTFGTAGFCHLTGLKEVSVKLGGPGADNFDIKTTESALEAAVKNHTNSPVISVQFRNVIFEGVEEKSTTKEAREEKIQGIRDGKKKEDIDTRMVKYPPIPAMDSSVEKIGTNKNPSGTLAEGQGADDVPVGPLMSIFSAVAGVVFSKLCVLIEKISRKSPEIAANVRFIKDDLEAIQATSNLHGPKIKHTEIAQLRQLTYDIEDGIDRFHAKKISLKDFARQIVKLKDRSTEMTERLNRFVLFAEGGGRTAQAQGAAVVPIELQNLGDDRISVMKRCQPTDAMLPYITKLSMCNNITLFCDDPRRLSVRPPVYGKLNLPQALSRLWTLAVFPAPGVGSRATYEAFIDFAKYKLLKERDHLGHLGIEDSIHSITRDIRYLDQLETLDLTGRQTVTVYKEVLMLPRLKHLFGRFQLSKEDTPFVPVKGVLKSDLEKFLRDKSVLETLAGFVIGTTLEFPQLMSVMRRLRQVKIWCESNASDTNLIDLSKAITEFIRKATGKPYFHRSLSIHFEESSREFTKKTVSVASILDSLELRGELSQFPPFVAGLSAIQELCFWSTGLSWEVIRDGLSRVRGLKYLKLIEDNLGSLDILSEAEHLKCIDRISVVCKQTLEVAIAAHPLPNLVSIHILCQDLHAISDNPIIEITYMVKLQEIALHHQVEDTIKDELLRTAEGHPNEPNVLFLEYPQ